MKLVSQILIVVLVAIGFLISLKRNFTGREAEEADGFVGAIVNIIVNVIILVLYYCAGTFSEIFK